ncbi:MAG: hypothetical protein P3T54_00230 [Dehalogenimonas sp.]|nr:hypothetical protein [Dehalogenimonas sp.]
MTSTPDTSFTIPILGSYSAYTYQLWRGAYSSSPVTANGSLASGAGNMPNPPSVTVGYDNSLVVAVGFIDDDDVSDIGAPPGYTNLTAGWGPNNDGSAGCTVAMASFVQNTSTEDPGAFSGSGNDEWKAQTIAIRPSSVSIPTVTTQAASDVADDSVTGNGNITATNGANCSRRGFCYLQGTSGDPTTANSVAYDDGTFGTGVFTKSITGLSAGTTYRVRAYAVNSAGTSYGSTVSVTTPQTASYSAQVLRVVTSAAGYSGQTLRQVEKAAGYSAQTLRAITVPASYSAQTLRIVGITAGYSAQVLRTVLSAGTYSAQTLRQIEKAAGYSAQTLRVITVPASYSAQTLRQITTGASCSAQTLRILWAPMKTTVKLGGVLVQRASQSLSLELEVGQRSTGEVIIMDLTGTASYPEGTPVLVERVASHTGNVFERLFAGFVENYKIIRIAPAVPDRYHALTLKDGHYLADKRYAAESYTGQTAGYIVNDLFEKYLEDEGVTIGSIETGPVVAEMVVNYVQVSKAFDRLAERCGFVWYIDEYFKLYFTAKTTTAAPWPLLSSDIFREGSPEGTLESSNPMYRNRQYVRAGKSLTDTQTETKIGDGSSTAFVVGFPIAKVPTITVDTVAQTVGIKGLDEDKDWYWNKGDAVITAAVAPTSAAVIVCQYQGEYEIMVVREKLDEIVFRRNLEGSTGIVEAVGDAPHITDRDALQEHALATLTHYGESGRQFSFPTLRDGLRPGQLLPVTHSAYNLSAEQMLIASVRISEFSAGNLRYDVNALSGPLIGDWSQFFRKLSGQSEDVLGRLNVGVDQVLIILVEAAEVWGWGESVSITPCACPLPSESLYPAEDLYPC